MNALTAEQMDRLASEIERRLLERDVHAHDREMVWLRIRALEQRLEAEAQIRELLSEQLMHLRKELHDRGLLESLVFDAFPSIDARTSS